MPSRARVCGSIRSRGNASASATLPSAMGPREAGAASTMANSSPMSEARRRRPRVLDRDERRPNVVINFDLMLILVSTNYCRGAFSGISPVVASSGWFEDECRQRQSKCVDI